MLKKAKEQRLLQIKTELAGKLGAEEMCDIGAWYAKVRNVGCPNCGIDFSELGRMANLYPHWTGGCLGEPEPIYEVNRPSILHRSEPCDASSRISRVLQ